MTLNRARFPFTVLIDPESPRVAGKNQARSSARADASRRVQVWLSGGNYPRALAISELAGNLFINGSLHPRTSWVNPVIRRSVGRQSKLPAAAELPVSGRPQVIYARMISCRAHSMVRRLIRREVILVRAYPRSMLSPSCAGSIPVRISICRYFDLCTWLLFNLILTLILCLKKISTRESIICGENLFRIIWTCFAKFLHNKGAYCVSLDYFVV